MVRQDKELVTIESKWPSILAWMMDYPNTKLSELYSRFKTGLDMNFSEFVAACKARNLNKLTDITKGKKGKRQNKLTKTDSLQTTEAAIETFKATRKSNGFLHLERMSKIVGIATDIVEAESGRLNKFLKDDKGALASKLLDGHLNRAAQVDKLARNTYGIDNESNEDKAKANVAILMNFNPQPSASSSNSGTVIDV